MGSLDDPNLKIRPVDDSPTNPAPNRRTIVGVAAVAVAAFAAIFLSTGQSTPPSGTTVPQAIPPVTTFAPPSPTYPDAPPISSPRFDLTQSATVSDLMDAGMRIWDLLPEATGEFAVVVGSPTSGDFVRVSRDNATVQLQSPIGDWGSLAYDQSGQNLAYIGDSPTIDGPALYIESDHSMRIIDWAYSFSWHATIPDRITWLTVGSDPELCWGDFGGPGEPAGSVCVPATDEQYLVGFDDGGFLTIDYAGRTIVRLGPDGQKIASTTGDHVALGPAGAVLVIVRDFPGEGTIFTTNNLDFTNPVRLEWAPSDSTGTPVVAAWSPSVSYPEIAFITLVDHQFQMQVWGLDGELRHSLDLEGRVWDIEWDSTGRYILIPGAVDTARILYVFDAFNSTLVTLPFGGWVQQAELVTPSICEDGTDVTASFRRRLQPDVQLGPARMVKSRDVNLRSHYFVSAVIVGGPDDGQIATWALPGFSGSLDPIDAPSMETPINEATVRLGLTLPSVGSGYSTAEWLQFDGVLASQRCAFEAGE
jgi:hypothetical protein